MRSKARRALGKYFIPEGDARRVQTDIKPKKRSFDKFRSYFGDKYEKIEHVEPKEELVNRDVKILIFS